MTESTDRKKKMRQSEEDKTDLIITAYRFRVREDRLSEKMCLYLNQSFGNQRFVWNYFLGKMNDFYQSQKTLKKIYTDNQQTIPESFRTFLSFQDMCKILTELKKTRISQDILAGKPENHDVYHFLNDTHSQPLQSTLRFLSDAMAEFAKGKKGKPRFKKKGVDTDSLPLLSSASVRAGLGFPARRKNSF